MNKRKNIFAIVGSASSNSANLKLVEKIAGVTSQEFNVTIYNDLKSLPHFDPELSANNPPQKINELRLYIERADAVLICTPEYVFSIPSGLKNAIEWCIATTVFTNKPTGLITASASGTKAHEELQLIMQTAMAKFTNQTCLLIQGIKGKFDAHGNFIDTETEKLIRVFANNLVAFVNELNTTKH